MCIKFSNWKMSCLLPFDRNGDVECLCQPFLSFVYFQIMAIGNISVELISLPFGALLFAVLVKPIKVKRWKTYVRIAAGAILFVSITTALISFYLRDN